MVTAYDGPTAEERRLRELCHAQDFEAAATLALETYGEEIGRYLAALARTPDDAAEAFARFSEDLWRGLPGFEGRASVRTWSYALARHALARLGREPARRAARNLPLSAAGSFARLEQQVREATAAYRRTTIKDRLRALRDRLSEEERELLVLRIDRGLDWREVALVLAGSEEIGAEPLRREAARLRKRFERLKARLRSLAEDEGLLPPPGGD